MMEDLTYERIKSELGVDLQANRGPWATAEKALREEEKIFFLNVRSVGYRRVSEAEYTRACGVGGLRKTRNRARDTRRKLTSVDPLNLNSEERLKHSATVSLLGAVEKMSSTKARERVGQQIRNNGSMDPIAAKETLKLFHKE
jgi:hypothetical protein